MSERQWKPGDVAMVNDCTRPDAPWKAATCVVARTSERETTWRLHGTGSEVWGSVSSARPLVVIDPADHAQVERLAEAITASESAEHGGGSCRSGSCFRDCVADALREFANPKPPKPDEPTGLGAVVEDDEGDHWVRINITPQPKHHWRTWWGNRPWAEITAVRVLSEGVQP